MMQSSGKPNVYRSMWKCGCVVDCLEPSPTTFKAPVDWLSCGIHGGPLSARAAAADGGESIWE